MPEYVVEDMQTEEQVDSFKAKNLDMARERMINYFEENSHIKPTIEIRDDFSFYLVIYLPYGNKYVWEVGQVGK